MANFNKAFNFRGGFQVDTDVLIVRGQNVGIGSTIPNERLVVDGIIQANGLKVNSSEPVAIQTANVGFLSATNIHVGVTSISSGIITATSTAGVVTYYGDGGRLKNLPTSQWLDIDVGLGFTSIYAQGYVGVNTNDPRYVFQVGGVPYPKAGLNVFQPGVGIETGTIWASGDVNLRGGVNAAQTVNAAQFVGMGSGITALNASNLGVGSIPSNVYGDEIYTGTVYGDLVGTATTAASVVPGADLVFDTATVRELEATQRFFTTNGKFQVGTDLASNVGDFDVRKTVGDSEILSISDTGSAKVFAGSQRPGGGISYGGIRFGGNVLADPLSTPNDLDIVNYDVGNLNFYLHAGSSGVTTGKYQWIYGQSDRSLADLDRLGKFTFHGNVNPTDPTIDVVGLTNLQDDLIVGGGVSIARNVTMGGNLDVDGDLTLTGNIGITTDSLVLPSTQFTGEVTVGSGPLLGGGVGLSTSGMLTANSFEVIGGATTNFSVSSGGAVDAQGIGCTGLFAQFLVETPRIVGQDYTGANGFRNDASGANFDELDVTNFNATNGFIENFDTNAFNADGIVVGGIPITGVGGTLFIDGDVSFGSTITTQPNLKTETVFIGVGNSISTLTNSLIPNQLTVDTPLEVPEIVTNILGIGASDRLQLGFSAGVGTQGPALIATVVSISTVPADTGTFQAIIPMVKVSSSTTSF